MLKVESRIEKVWTSIMSASLAAGMDPEKAVVAADHAALAYEARFTKATDVKIGATVRLDVRCCTSSVRC